jgi:GT2 family glycosyltransferase
MPICIAGMHRSGTSLVARLLNLCGLYLGPESDLVPAMPDNPEGFWENVHFGKLNDEILAALDSGWDVPPVVAEGWELQPEMIPLRERAAQFVLQFGSKEPWGWKDPRNSITLSFWKRMFPNLRVVVCLRNPLEVVQSLKQRGYSSEVFGLKLWLTYNQRLLAAAQPEHRVVTHYDAYFHDPRSELRRITALLNMTASEEDIDRACAAASPALRHNRATTQELLEAKVPFEIFKLYMDLCAEAGPVYQAALQGETSAEGQPSLSLDSIQRDYADALRVLRLESQLEALEQERKELVTLRDELAHRDVQMKRLRDELVYRDGRLKQLRDESTHLGRELHHFKSELAHREEEFKELKGELVRREEEFKELRSELAHRDKNISQFSGELVRRDELLKELVDSAGSVEAQWHAAAKWGMELDAQVKTLGAQMAEKEKELAHRDEEFKELRSELGNRDIKIKQLGGALMRRDEQLKELAPRAASLEAERTWLREQIRGMQATKFWRLGAQYWRIHARVKSLFQRPKPNNHLDERMGDAGVQMGDQRFVSDESTNSGHPPDVEVSEAHPPMGDDRPATSDLTTPDAGLNRIAEVLGTAVPPDATGLVVGQATPWPRFEKVIAEFQSRFDHDPDILDWHTGLNLAAAFPRLTILSPPTAESTLPYLDHSIDIVVISSSGPDAFKEAQRVATAAVVTCKSSDLQIHSTHLGAEADLEIKVDWQLPEVELSSPSVSIIIPCHNCAPHTENCLTALTETLPHSFMGEIVVVDDASTDETSELLKRWVQRDQRFKILRNETNAGFIASCNHGATAAVGEILVFLNNDTVPLPGWLPALLRTFREHPEAGAVGGKLILPDGSLQEAGSIIFSDGSAANFGRGDRDLDAPLYNYVREVDYCTGACLATKRQLFMELGGFDTRYCPAYYEDVDYCFQLRQEGYRVYYQPETAVIHFEGATSGTDLSAGVKQYQVVNQAKFYEKWVQMLKGQPERPRRFDALAWYSLAVRDGLEGVENR